MNVNNQEKIRQLKSELARYEAEETEKQREQEELVEIKNLEKKISERKKSNSKLHQTGRNLKVIGKNIGIISKNIGKELGKFAGVDGKPKDAKNPKAKTKKQKAEDYNLDAVIKNLPA